MSFGADTDYFGFADTTIHLVSSSKTPNKSEAQCVDSYGDVDSSTMYDTFSDYQCVYNICADRTLSLYDTGSAVDFRLGKVTNSIVITSEELSTENTARPTFTITGRSTSASDSLVNKYTPSDLEIACSRKAIPVGVTVDTVTRCTGSSVSASVSVAYAQDSGGDEGCLDVYGGRVEASNDLVGCTGDPGATVVAGWTISSGPSVDQQNTGYATGSVSAFKNLSRDT